MQSHWLQLGGNLLCLKKTSKEMRFQEKEISNKPFGKLSSEDQRHRGAGRSGDRQ